MSSITFPLFQAQWKRKILRKLVAPKHKSVRRCIVLPPPTRCIYLSCFHLLNNCNYNNPLLFARPERYHSSILSRLHLFREWHHPNFLARATVQDKEAWLNRLLLEEEAEMTSVVDTAAYLVVLKALARSKLPDAHLRAERWLVRLEKHAKAMEEINDALKVTAECYCWVIQAWAEASNEDPKLSVIRAERWLTKLKDQPKYSSLRPDTACFNAFLDVCSRGRGIPSIVRQHAKTAQQTLLYMIADRKSQGKELSTISPNRESFNYVIRAWTRCRNHVDVADQAMRALQHLENYQASVDPDVGPDRKSYNMVMDAIAVRAKLKVKQLKTKRRLWSDPDANGLNEIKLLNEILSYMREMAASDDEYEQSLLLSPDTSAMNTLVSAWSHLSSVIHPNAPHEAEKILRHMIALKDQGVDHCAPDSVTYLMVMRAWANSEAPHNGKRVAWWLERQWNDYEFEGRRKSLKPTTASYNMVIQVWAELGDPLKAEKALAHLVALSNRHPHDTSTNLSPNSESYAFVIRAWLAVAEKGSKEALVTAVRWLDALREQEQRGKDDPSGGGLHTQVDLYNRILRAARKCASQYPDVLDLAVETFDKLRESHHAVECTHYSRLLQVGLFALSHPQHNDMRSAFVTQIVKDCCEDGLMSKQLLSALADGPTYHTGWTIQESRRMVSEVIPDSWPLPASWTRNVKQSHYFFPDREDLKRANFDIFHHGDDPYKF